MTPIRPTDDQAGGPYVGPTAFEREPGVRAPISQLATSDGSAGIDGLSQNVEFTDEPYEARHSAEANHSFRNVVRMVFGGLRRNRSLRKADPDAIPDSSRFTSSKEGLPTTSEAGDVQRDRSMVVLQPAIQTSPASRELLRPFQTLRAIFVDRMGWKVPGRKPGEPDIDRYDTDRGTRSFLRFEGPELVAGMRLTAVDSIKQSLTWGMLPATLQQQIMRDNKQLLHNLDKAAAAGRVWDLTRLVLNEESHTLKQAGIMSMPKLFGSAMSETGTDAVWWFMVDSKMLRYLNMSGMAPHKVLWSGKVDPEDNGECSLCYIVPDERYRRNQATPGEGGELWPFTRDLLRVGMASSEADPDKWKRL